MLMTNPPAVEAHNLIKTFGQQLGGISQVRSTEGEGTVVELVFPDPDLSPDAAGV